MHFLHLIQRFVDDCMIVINPTTEMRSQITLLPLWFFSRHDDVQWLVTRTWVNPEGIWVRKIYFPFYVPFLLFLYQGGITYLN
jgi:hypothetical protein